MYGFQFAIFTNINLIMTAWQNISPLVTFMASRLVIQFVINAH